MYNGWESLVLLSDKVIELYFPLYNAGHIVITSDQPRVEVKNGGLGSGQVTVHPDGVLLFYGGEYRFTSSARFNGGHCLDVSRCGQIRFAASNTDTIELAGKCERGGFEITRGAFRCSAYS